MNRDRALSRMRRLGDLTAGNRATILADGDTAFRELWEAVAGSRRRVWLETYTLTPDRIGERTVEELARAADRGCDVILLYDDAGSPRVGDRFVAPIREAGGRAVAFNPIWPWRRKGPLSFRDHRKIWIADDVAFCGGMNINEEYAGPELGTGRFRDTQVRLEGPAVADLARLYVESLRETRAAPADRGRAPGPGRAESADGVIVQVVASNPRRRRRAVQRTLRRAIAAAESTCRVTTPYFLPPRRITAALTRAARRGVDVRVLTAGISDVPIVRFAAQHVYGRFLRAGVRVYELFGKTLHAKTLTVDGEYGSVGSFNLDPLSDRRNLEVTVNVLDGDVAAHLDRDFEADLESAREVSLEEWGRRGALKRGLQWGLYQLLHV